MTGSDRHPSAPRSYVVLAGIETGVLGGLAMMAWLAVVSLWHGRSVWSIANLLATTFHGESALRRGFRWMTVSGLALHFAAAGLLGAAFSVVASRMSGRARIMLLGLLVGVGWYYLWFGYLWNQVNPLVPLYSPDGGMLVAHLALGAFLGSCPRFWRNLEAPHAAEGDPDNLPPAG
ncbi:MAG: hypothetical protein HYR60_01010 [Acidobacteria bacterium]|nr:hypothetical protein [Acidobacteriota bacterium]